MARRSVAAIVVSVLVIFAGCGGVLGGDSGNKTTVKPGLLPPGVSQSGVTDSTQLAQAHAVRLSSTSFAATYSLSITQRTQQGSRQQRTTQRIKATTGFQRFILNVTNRQGSQGQLAQYWGNKSVGLVLQQAGNQTRFRMLPESVNRSTRFTFAEAFVPLLNIGDYEVQKTKHVNGETLIVLQATAVNSSLGSGDSGTIDAENVSNVSSTLVVGTEGVIYEFDLSFNASTTNGQVFYSASFEILGSGGIRVPKPGWIDEAMANVTIANLSASLDNGTVSITHNGGDPILPGAPIAVQVNETVYQGSLSTVIRPNQTVYLALNQSAQSVAVVQSRDAATMVSGRVIVVIYANGQRTLLQATLNTSSQTQARMSAPS